MDLVKSAKNNKTLVILGAIVLLAAVLRFWDLGEYSLWVDEPQVYASAKSILETGVPQFHSDHLYTRDLPHLYLNAASMFVFGENEFAVRFISVLAGLGIVVVSYRLARELWNEHAAILAALLTAVHPWLVAYSRISRSYILVSFFLLLATYFAIRYVREERMKHLLLLTLSGVLAIMTHQTGQTVLLLYIPLFVLLVLPQFSIKRLFTVSLPFVVIFLALIAAKSLTRLAYFHSADQRIEYLSQQTWLDAILSYIPVQATPHFEYIFFIENPAFLPFVATAVIVTIGVFLYGKLNKQQRVFVLLLAVLLGILVFSRKAVRVNRAVMYISPFLMISLALITTVISDKLKSLHRAVPIAVVGVLVLSLGIQSVAQVSAGYGDSINEHHSFFEGINYRVDMKTTFEYVAQHAEPNDQIIVMGSPKFAVAYMDGRVPDYYVWTGTQITVDDGYHYVVKSKLIDSLDELETIAAQKNTWVITTYSISNLPRVNHISGSIRKWINNKGNNLQYQSTDPYARVYYLPVE